MSEAIYIFPLLTLLLAVLNKFASTYRLLSLHLNSCSCTLQEHGDGIHELHVSNIHTDIERILEFKCNLGNLIQMPIVTVVVSPKQVIPVQMSFCHTWKVFSVVFLVYQLRCPFKAVMIVHNLPECISYPNFVRALVVVAMLSHCADVLIVFSAFRVWVILC